MFSREDGEWLTKRSNGKKWIDFSFNLKLNILMKAELIAAYAIEHAFYLYHRVLLLFELEVI